MSKFYCDCGTVNGGAWAGVCELHYNTTTHFELGEHCYECCLLKWAFTKPEYEAAYLAKVQYKNTAVAWAPALKTNIKIDCYKKTQSGKWSMNALCFTDGQGDTFYFSYQTLVAVKLASGTVRCSMNYWNKTTGAHLNKIEPSKYKRLNHAAFQVLLNKLLAHDNPELSASKHPIFSQNPEPKAPPQPDKLHAMALKFMNG